MSASEAVEVSRPGPPEALRTGALALAALEYWDQGRKAHLAIRFVEREAARLGLDRSLLRFDLEIAVLAAEALHELSTSGHPKIRDRAASALPIIVRRITAFVEHRP